MAHPVTEVHKVSDHVYSWFAELSSSDVVGNSGVGIVLKKDLEGGSQAEVGGGVCQCR